MKKANKLMLGVLLALAFVVGIVFSQSTVSEIASAERISNENVHIILNQGAVATTKREAKKLEKTSASRVFGSELLTIIN